MASWTDHSAAWLAEQVKAHPVTTPSRPSAGAIFNSPSASASVRAGYHTQTCIPHNAELRGRPLADGPA